ncbi:MAG: right-handed parallel beta-helix repeat-containing protein [Candidatus Tritonobacter lacicola]|nr:right-handed parallel beta-helix repeat-containing protein [Candidatus Tritonobacter lacicola]
MKRITGFGFSVVAVLLWIGSGQGAIIYVPDQYHTIQEGIDAAQGGDVIVVGEGVYPENITFDGKAITVRSVAPGIPDVVDATIIDGGQNGSVVTFDSGEGADSILTGLTIRNGHADDGGGIYCEDSSPLITGNVIVDNSVDWGGGGIYCHNGSPMISDNRVEGNSAIIGGGIQCEYYSSSPIVVNNIIRDNSVSGDGGGIHCCGSTLMLIGNLIEGNTAGEGPYYSGGGIFIGTDSSFTSINNIIAGNTAGRGGGLATWISNSWLMNTVIVDNEALSKGGAIHSMGCYPEWDAVGLTDCIVWDNTAPYWPVFYSDFSSVCPGYSDVQGGYPGEGNIDADPLFVHGPDGDYYLSQVPAGQPSDSPCVNAGSDLAGNICFDTTDESMCMDELTTHTDEVTDLGQVDMGYHYGFPPLPDRVIYVDEGNVSGPWEGTREHPHQYIQGGVDSADYGDTIFVAQGEYQERVTLAQGIALYGGYEGTNWTRDIEEYETTIVNEWTEPVPNNYTVIAADECRIDGFTIRGFDGIQSHNCSPIVINNTVHVENVGLYTRNDAHPLITRNKFYYNDSNNAFECWEDAYPTIVNNLIVGNAEDGICIGHNAHPFISNNTIYINGDCGIGCFGSSTPTIQNNIIVANGAGIRCRESAVPEILYNDVWSNSGLNYDGCAPGTGDISEDPLFVSPGDPGEDYRLQEDSPCIDMGIDAGAPRLDFEGTPRPVDIPGVGHEVTNTTDMGAHEYQSASAVAVVINEVAWAGTAASSTDEWVELYNNSPTAIDLTGWELCEDGGDQVIIPLSGTVQGHGYFLIERTDDTTVIDIPANTVGPFSGSGLHNSGEHLVLKNASEEIEDEVDCSGGWYAGTSTEKRTMERIDPAGEGSDPGNWASNDGITTNGHDADWQPLTGTARSANSASSKSSREKPRFEDVKFRADSRKEVKRSGRELQGKGSTLPCER